jgi:hypothetical protein
MLEILILRFTTYHCQKFAPVTERVQRSFHFCALGEVQILYYCQVTKYKTKPQYKHARIRSFYAVS